ncbi:hypothetical protein [Aureibacter tunicatorum]|uniref:Uncharacterized protein n=1 Tax=Aureibacter tunicatorum TaxID=866807 RepID=A0AAE4BT02_9BACT|nr:hypothetical protein [Aureibacter tunicatorum]MDR6239353.1 hypothetical protein [Aureibacter tunicatorum]BDD04724.1 hypothetical protein AUTU_22070 [Aureibacter tunicatorum]
MIYRLRRIHYNVWLIFAFLLTGLLILAYATRPATLYELVISQDISPQLGEVVKTSQTNYLLVNIRQIHRSNPNDIQLEILVKKPLKAPFGILSVLTKSKEIIVGRIGQKGVYRFRLRNIDIDEMKAIVVSDAIKDSYLMEVGL